MNLTPTEPAKQESSHSSRQSDPARAKEAIIFIHLPKTAGTTLNRLIEWEYPLTQMYSVDPVFFEWSAAHLRNLPEHRLRRMRMFKGHMFFGLHEVLPQPSTYITVLRNPIDRVLSAYYYMSTYKLHPTYWRLRREGWSVEQYVERSTRDNVQSKIIARADYHAQCTEEILKRAIDHLDRYFSVVGLSERFEESLALMKLRFGWQLKSYSSFNVTRARPKKADLPQALLDRIAEKNKYDLALYEHGKRLFETAVGQQADAVARIAKELKAARAESRGSVQATLFSMRSAARKALNRVYSTI
jgi:hypothetical protein